MTFRPLLILLGGCALAGPVMAGSLDAPAAPSSAGSAMYTLEDLYQRLNAGTAGTPRSGTFAEPATGPGSTMHTLTEIMGKMPALDNTSGATAADVLSGKTFWGLTGGAWGKQTGTIPAGANATGADGQLVITLPDGLYTGGKTATVSDSDLNARTIKSGVNIFGVAGAWAGPTVPFPVAKTGQTTSYGTRDDGALAPQTGAAWPNPRFTDNGNGTVTDNLTGLVWLKNVGCTGTMTWSAARTWAAALAAGSCGLSDGSTAGQWRLPTIKELSSLIHAGVGSPAVPNSAGTGRWQEGDPFAGVQSNAYWSSTTYVPDSSYAWDAYLADGNVSAISKTSSYYAWPVRGGQ
ncbi:MAG: DUF1566 domain-containing protein [Candidatus Competibacteraceae bacterium]